MPRTLHWVALGGEQALARCRRNPLPFGARRQRSKAVSYVLFYRTQESRQRWFTIGGLVHLDALEETT